MELDRRHANHARDVARVRDVLERREDGNASRLVRGDMMTAKKTPKEPKATAVDPSFVPVVAAFVRNRHVGCGRMFSSNSVLNVDGKIFAMLVRGKFVAKLPKQRVDELVSRGRGQYFDPGHGRLMKQWVSVGAGRANWVELAKEAYRFVKRGTP